MVYSSTFGRYIGQAIGCKLVCLCVCPVCSIIARKCVKLILLKLLAMAYSTALKSY